MSDHSFTLADQRGEPVSSDDFDGRVVVFEGLIRSTFVLGPDGEVEHAWRNVRAKSHVARVARELGISEG
ncbi:MAG: hypothetical protein KY460_01380 [Actinobacteria bacterium]|nr:hypothetical protein [Actinomycetota bacterium]